MSTVKPPYFGAAYYPEAWPMEQVDADIVLMQKAGMNVMRLGEFAWSRMEPREGQYDFDWLHTVVDKLARAGIGVIMGTPTATPPSWLSSAHPEILLMNEQGTQAQHGARRHVCSNNPVYRDYCERIVTRLAEEFGHDNNVIGWQIDNEIYPFSPRGCCCPVCHQKFQEAMRARFGSIEALNAAWCTALWSQTYGSFSELPVPRTVTWHHPALLSAWMMFQSDSNVEFIEHQAHILHRLTTRPVGTDMMPKNGQSYYKTTRNLDVIQFNHYYLALWYDAFWMDFCRALKQRPFWVTETSTCWSGGVAVISHDSPGFCRANTWLAPAMGAEANLYWLWRAHRAGQELMHGSVISSCGRPMHMFDEVRAIGAGFKKCAGFISGTRPAPPRLAIHVSCAAHWLFEYQPIANEFKYGLGMVKDYYRPLIEAQLRVDVIDPAMDLSPYRMVCTPYLPFLDEEGLRDRLKSWIEAGGIWVVGPFSDIRDGEGAKFSHAPFGSLEAWTGVKCLYEIPGEIHRFTVQWQEDGAESKGSVWFYGLETKQAESLAFYLDGPLKGLSAITQSRLGKGQIIILGTMPEPAVLQKLFLHAAVQAGITPVAKASANLMVVPREGSGGRGLMAVELENKPATMELPLPMTDLLTDKKLSGKVELPPYGVLVLKGY